MLIVLSISVIAAASIMFFSRRLLCYLRHFQDNQYNPTLFKDWLVANGVYDRKGSMVATLVALILEVTKMEELPAFILCLISAAGMVWLSLQEVDPRKSGHPILKPTRQARGIYHLALSLYSIALVCLVVILHGHNADDEDLAAYWLIVIVAIQSSPIWLIFANRLLQLSK
jgi:UDP-N-acetylmuramoyl-tripeptide--D-alanyl-D-alanine ligase